MRALFAFAIAVLGALFQTWFETADVWQRPRAGAKPSALLGPLTVLRRSIHGTAP